VGDPCGSFGEPCRVYEQEAVRCVVDEAIRPGGLALTAYALSRCVLPEGSRVLDVGCGMGATVAYCRAHGLAAAGVDASDLLLHAGDYDGAALPMARGTGLRLPFAGVCADALFAECSLSLMPSLADALAEFFRVLRPGGWLIVSDLYARSPEHIPLLRALPLACCLSSALSQQTLLVELRAQGFTPVIWEDHSEALKQFAARLIFEHGSLAQFWSAMTAGSLDGDAVQCVVGQAKPGYFLLIARKQA